MGFPGATPQKSELQVAKNTPSDVLFKNGAWMEPGLQLAVCQRLYARYRTPRSAFNPLHCISGKFAELNDEIFPVKSAGILDQVRGMEAGIHLLEPLERVRKTLNGLFGEKDAGLPIDNRLQRSTLTIGNNRTARRLSFDDGNA